MTSDVKGWEQLFYVCLIFSPLSIGRARARKTRRLITRISVGWFPPSLHPSGACLHRGTSVPCGLFTPPRVPPHRGGVSCRERLETLQACAATRRHLYAVGDPSPCWAMAHRKARNARAMATMTCLALLPLAMSWRYRLQSRTGAFQLMAWIAVGSFARRSGR